MGRTVTRRATTTGCFLGAGHCALRVMGQTRASLTVTQGGRGIVPFSSWEEMRLQEVTDSCPRLPSRGRWSQDLNPSLPHSKIIPEMSLTQVLLRSGLLNLQILVGFPARLLLLISSSVSLWSRIMLCMISSFFFFFCLLNLLGCVFWSRMRSLLVNVPCEQQNLLLWLGGVFHKHQLGLVD